MKQSYTYDQVNRLAQATEKMGVNLQWQQIYDYDVWGNRAVRVGSHIPVPRQTPTSNSPSDLPFLFNQTTNRISATTDYGYDAAGNLSSTPNTTSGADTMAFDGENRQLSYTKAGGGTTNYSYDGECRRIKKVDSGTTVFVYDVSGQLIAEYTTALPSGPGGTSYLTTDHLGSTRVVTTAVPSPTVKARYDYLPFGEQIASTIGNRSSVAGYVPNDSTRQKFTQKERDIESGLDYLLARYYSSAQGRFMSVDPLTGRATIPQSWNGYAYAWNNPLALKDPDGRWPYSVLFRLEKLGNYFAHGYYESNWQWQRRVSAARAFLTWQERFRAGLYVRNNYVEQIGPGQYAPGYWGRLDISSLSDNDAVSWAAKVNDAINSGSMVDVSETEKRIADVFAGLLPIASQAASQIAKGHAWGKHQNEFPGWDQQKFTDKIEETIKTAKGSDVKALSRGRSAYWNDQEKMVVIRDPNSPDGGTAFRPTNGKAYFNNLK